MILEIILISLLFEAEYPLYEGDILINKIKI